MYRVVAYSSKDAKINVKDFNSYDETLDKARKWLKAMFKDHYGYIGSLSVARIYSESQEFRNIINDFISSMYSEKYTKYFSMPQQKNVDLVQLCGCYEYDGASDFTLAIIKQK